MTFDPDRYFALIVPCGILLLGAVLAVCGSVLRQQQYLRWMALGYILPAVGLAVQSLLPNMQLARWSVLVGGLYLCGIWAFSHGMALRCSGRTHGRLAAGIVVAALALLAYHAWVVDQLWMRAMVLNAALAMLLLLPLRAVVVLPEAADRLEWLLRISYLCGAVYAVLRTALLVQRIPVADLPALTRSGYWLSMLFVALLFGMWFLFVLLACAIRDAMRILHEERNRDPLTLLLNRRAFFESAGVALDDPRQGPWALLVCDLDHFKQINDTWGHGAGDQVLQTVAQTLSAQVRRGDPVARFGGEEFIVLLRDTSPEMAELVAQRIRMQLSQMRFPGVAGTVTASFGVTPVASSQDLHDAIARADAALYRVKNGGRNQVCMVVGPHSADGLSIMGA